nr:hypothetical protein [Tanacetum cinerariifolium]
DSAGTFISAGISVAAGPSVPSAPSSPIRDLAKGKAIATPSSHVDHGLSALFVAAGKKKQKALKDQDEKETINLIIYTGKRFFSRVKTSVRSLNPEIAYPGRSSDRGGNLANRTEARNEF